jgi:hypothetical protein
MLIFKALHVLTMFAMVSVFLGAQFFYTAAVLRRDVHGLAWVHRVEGQTKPPLGILGVAFLVAGIVFGLLTAVTSGLDVFAGWLVAAYVLIVAFLVNVALVGVRLIRLADMAVEAEKGERPAEEVIRELRANRVVLLFLPANVAIFAAVILDMVLKPF